MMNRLFLAVLILGSVLIFTACDKNKDKNENTTNEQPTPIVTGQEAVSPVPSINLVKKKNKVNYLLTNGIEVKIEGKDSIRVEGLVNKQTEDLLNKNINEEYNREMDAYLKNYKENSWLYPSVDLNANNLLSFSMGSSYEDEPQLGFLFRLTDGTRLQLKDIFTEGTDYKNLLRDKILEKILDTMGEDCYMQNRRRVSVLPNHSFSLSESDLYIIFPNGEKGLITDKDGLANIAIKIPLNEIDDYVQVMDLYSGTERKTHEHLERIKRKNNIILKNTGKIFELSNGKVFSQFPKIVGFKDKGFEEEVNRTLENSVQEIINEGYFADATKAVGQYYGEELGVIQMVTEFNHYGYFTVSRNVNSWEYDKYNYLYKIYTFDMFKKKQIDMKSLLAGYLKDKPDIRGKFVSLIKADMDGTNTAKQSLSYEYIMEKGDIFFRQGFFSQDPIEICGSFIGKTQKGNYREMFSIPYSEVIKITPEEFFGN